MLELVVQSLWKLFLLLLWLVGYFYSTKITVSIYTLQRTSFLHKGSLGRDGNWYIDTGDMASEIAKMQDMPFLSIMQLIWRQYHKNWQNYEGFCRLTVCLLRWRWGPKYVQKPNIFFKNIKKCYHIFPECLITSGYYKIISVHFEAVFKTKKATLAVCRSKIRERQLSISTKY